MADFECQRASSFQKICKFAFSILLRNEIESTDYYRIIFVYDKKEGNISSIKVFKGQNLIHELTLESEITNKVADYYSKLQEINQSLINVTDIVGDLRNEMNQMLETE